MDVTKLNHAALGLSNERSVGRVLDTIVETLAEQPKTALARIWLMEQPPPCDSEEVVPSADLVLAASDGRSVAEDEPRWRGLKGKFRRFALGERKVGRIAQTRTPVFLTNVQQEANWMRDPAWGAREGILSFAGQPLIFGGEVLGVLAIFSREVLEEEALSVLRNFADHAAAAVANARAFEEIECLQRQLELENEYLRAEVLDARRHGDILGESSAIAKVVQQIELVAPTDSTVLIEGESGTGKELIARAIHARGDRSTRPLIAVNCASITRELFESEFFGHVKGAFTGAHQDRAGRFELADGGTLFLDEVGEIPLELQGKLLRVIQEGEFERVGDQSTRSVDVRIIAATNVDLKRASDEGIFRRDLYFRLSVFPIASPPLRERPEDIPILATRFLESASTRLRVPPPTLKQRHVLELQQYEWPGNVRELQNVMERAAITSQTGTLRLDLPTTSTPRRQTASVKRDADDPMDVMTYAQLKELEVENLRRALKWTNGKVAGQGGAAELLGSHPTTLASRIKRLGLKPSRIP